MAIREAGAAVQEGDPSFLKPASTPAKPALIRKAAPRSKLKGVAPTAAQPSKPKILIFGKPGVGKTWTSLDFPSCYYIDTEGGANLKHYTDKLAKSGGLYFGPDQDSQDFATVIEQVQALATEDHPYKTVIIDSISKIFNSEISNEAERLGDKDAFGASKKPAVSLTRRLINWIDRIDMNVILIAHEKPLWGKGEQIGVTFDAYDKLEYELHLCLNIIKTGDSRRAIVKKSRLLEFKDADSFDWSYENFANKYGKEIIEAKGKVTVLSTPEQITELKALMEVVKLPDDQCEKWFKAAGVASFEEMDEDKMLKIIGYVKSKLPITKGE